MEKIKIEDLPTYEIEQLIVDRVILDAGSMDNLRSLKQDYETDQDYEDRIWEEAFDMVMDACVDIEDEGEYDFSSYDADEENIMWYDEAREDAVRDICAYMMGLA